MAINVIQYGMGFIGQKAVQLMLRQGFNVVAAIDTKEDCLGKDVGELAGLDRNIGVKVTNDVAGTLKQVKADIVSHATVTKLEPLYDQIKPCIEAGFNVASIAEELAYPWIRYPELAKEIDENAKKHNVTVIGSGVNPGLMMDLVPLTLAGACWKIDKVRVMRVVDFGVYSPTRGSRRFGIKPEEFNKGVAEKKIPIHTGLYESITMISDALGWKLDDITESWEVMTSRTVRKTPWYTVEPGTTCGIKQTGMGLINGEAKVVMDIYGMVHPSLEEDGVELGDTTWIEGEPSITIKTSGGTNQRGELVTTARLVNILPAVVDARPGLISVKDLPATPPRV